MTPQDSVYYSTQMQSWVGMHASSLASFPNNDPTAPSESLIVLLQTASARASSTVRHSPTSSIKTTMSSSIPNLRIVTSIKPTTQIRAPGLYTPTHSSQTRSNMLSSTIIWFSPIPSQVGPTSSKSNSLAIISHSSPTITTRTSSPLALHSSSLASVYPMYASPSSIVNHSDQLSPLHTNTVSHGVVITLIVFGVLASVIVLTSLWTKDKLRRFCGARNLDDKGLGLEEFDSFAGKHGAIFHDAIGAPNSLQESVPNAAGDGFTKSRVGVRKNDRKRIASHHLSISRPFAPGSRPFVQSSSSQDHSSRATGRMTWLGWTSRQSRNNLAYPIPSNPTTPQTGHIPIPPSIVVSAPTVASSHFYEASSNWPLYAPHAGITYSHAQGRSGQHLRTHTETETEDPYSDSNHEERGSAWWESGRRGY